MILKKFPDKKACKKVEKIIQKAFVSTCGSYKQSNSKAAEISLVPEMKLDVSF